MKLTFEITWPCAKCKQTFTDLDLANSNYSLTILPNINLQHQVCPRTKTKTNPNPCGFDYPKDLYQKTN